LGQRGDALPSDGDDDLAVVRLGLGGDDVAHLHALEDPDDELADRTEPARSQRLGRRCCGDPGLLARTLLAGRPATPRPVPGRPAARRPPPPPPRAAPPPPPPRPPPRARAPPPIARGPGLRALRDLPAVADRPGALRGGHRRGRAPRGALRAPERGVPRAPQ